MQLFYLLLFPADDIIAPIDVSTDTNRTFTGLSLVPGTKYYITVDAENSIGMRTSHSSDGFVVDNSKPIPGVVYNTDRYHNTLWYSSSGISASWSGFVDAHSYVKEYHVALAKSDITNAYITNGFEHAEFLNTHAFKNILLEQGQKYVVLVKAIDSAGLESDVVSSIPFLVDTTPPTAFRCSSEYEIVTGFVEINDSFTWTENITLSMGTFYRIYLNTTGMYEGGIVQLHVGTSFHILPLIRSYDGNYHSDFTFESPNRDITSLSVIGNLPIPSNFVGFATIIIYKCLSEEIISKKATAITQISQHQIAVDVKVHDEESGIKTIQVGVGTTRRGFQVFPLQKATTMYSVLVDVDLPHASPLFATVVAENHAGLRQDFTTPNVLILDHTPPKITDLETIIGYSVTASGKTTVLVNATWTVSEEESSVKLCSCAYGRYVS